MTSSNTPVATTPRVSVDVDQETAGDYDDLTHEHDTTDAAATAMSTPSGSQKRRKSLATAAISRALDRHRRRKDSAPGRTDEARNSAAIQVAKTRRFSLAVVGTSASDKRGSSSHGGGGGGLSSWLRKPIGQRRSTDAPADVTTDEDDDVDQMSKTSPTAGTSPTATTPLVSRFTRRCSTIVDYVVGVVGSKTSSRRSVDRHRRRTRLDAVLEAGSASGDDDGVDDQSVYDDGGFIGTAADVEASSLWKNVSGNLSASDIRRPPKLSRYYLMITS